MRTVPRRTNELPPLQPFARAYGNGGRRRDRVSRPGRPLQVLDRGLPSHCSVLAQVLRDGETAWDLEIQGSARTDVFGEWYASSRWLLRTRNLVIKGRYDPDVKRELTEEGLEYLLLDERPVMTRRPVPRLPRHPASSRSVSTRAAKVAPENPRASGQPEC